MAGNNNSDSNNNRRTGTGNNTGSSCVIFNPLVPPNVPAGHTSGKTATLKPIASNTRPSVPEQRAVTDSDIEAKKAELAKKNAELEEINNKLRDADEELIRRIEELREREAEAQSRIENAESRIEELREREAEAQSRIENAESRIEDIQRRKESLDADYDEIRNTVCQPDNIVLEAALKYRQRYEKLADRIETATDDTNEDIEKIQCLKKVEFVDPIVLSQVEAELADLQKYLLENHLKLSKICQAATSDEDDRASHLSKDGSLSVIDSHAD